MELREIRSGIAYEITTYCGDVIEIGKKDASSFKPCFTLNRWGGECKLAVSFDDSGIPDAAFGISGQTLFWDSSRISFKFYPKEPEIIEERVQDRTKNFKQNEYGALEFEIILKEKPQENEIRFLLDSENLVFYYQPPLHPEHPTWEAGKNGQPASIRPSNVVGSYAVYHKTRGSFHKKEDADKYKTSKAFHIYRPKAIDSNGNAVWCDLLIENNQLIIRLPEDFYNQASYPVKIDPTFGYTSVGGSSQDVNLDGWCNVEAFDIAYGSWFTCPEDCYPEKIYGYLDVDIFPEFFSEPCDGEAKTTFHISKRSNRSCIAYTEYKDWSTDSNFDGWLSLTLKSNPLLSANTDYWLFISNCWYSEDVSCTCDNVETWDVFYDSAEENKGAWCPTNCNGCYYPLPSDLGEWYSRIFSVYCVYSLRKEKSYSFDSRLHYMFERPFDMNFIANKTTSTSCDITSQLLGKYAGNYITDAIISRVSSRINDFNSILMHRKQLQSLINAALKSAIERYTSINALISTKNLLNLSTDSLLKKAKFLDTKHNVWLSLGVETSLLFDSMLRGSRSQHLNINSTIEMMIAKEYNFSVLTENAYTAPYNINSFLKVLTKTQFSINSYLEKTLLVNYAHSPFLTGLKVRCCGIDVYLTKRPFNIEIYNDSFTSLSWCSRWDEENWSVIIEIIADREARDAIRQHITPGAVAELHNILGEPRYIDTTYSSGNTIWLKGRRGLFNLRDPTKIAVKNYSERMLPDGRFLIKLEGYKL